MQLAREHDLRLVINVEMLDGAFPAHLKHGRRRLSIAGRHGEQGNGSYRSILAIGAFEFPDSALCCYLNSMGAHSFK